MDQGDNGEDIAALLEMAMLLEGKGNNEPCRVQAARRRQWQTWNRLAEIPGSKGQAILHTQVRGHWEIRKVKIKG